MLNQIECLCLFVYTLDCLDHQRTNSITLIPVIFIYAGNDLHQFRLNPHRKSTALSRVLVIFAPMDRRRISRYSACAGHPIVLKMLPSITHAVMSIPNGFSAGLAHQFPTANSIMGFKLGNAKHFLPFKSPAEINMSWLWHVVAIGFPASANSFTMLNAFSLMLRSSVNRPPGIMRAS